MKIRADFVTNSSSANYIVAAGISVKETARIMLSYALAKAIKDLGSGYDNWAEKSISTYLKRITFIDKVPDNIKGVCFTSVNYDTYIYEKEKEILVETCNNIAFYELTGTIFDNSYDDGGRQDKREVEFYSLDLNKVIKNEFYDWGNVPLCNCSDYSSNFATNDNKIICMKCGNIVNDQEDAKEKCEKYYRKWT